MVSPDPNIGNKFCKRINAALIKIIHARINKRKIFKNWIHPNDEIDVSCIKNQSLGGRREVEKQLSKVNVVSFILMWLVVWLTRFIRMVGRQPRLFPQTELWPPDPTEFTTVHWLWCEAVRREDSGCVASAVSDESPVLDFLGVINFTTNIYIYTFIYVPKYIISHQTIKNIMETDFD